MRKLLMALPLLAVLCRTGWGEKADVVVVEADGQRTREDAKSFTGNVTRCLDTFRIAYDKTSDSAVERGGLKGYKVAVFPYNPDMSDGQAAAVEQFVAAGGKVVAFYVIPGRVAALLGIRAARYQAKTYEGQFSAMRFKPGVAVGAPTEVKQSSWNIQAVTIEPPARVLAEWHDGAGKPTGFPAVVVSPNGAFMTHVMLTGDTENRAQFMLALLGHLLPSLWQRAVSGALGEVGKVSTCKSLDDLAQAVELAKKGGQNVAAAESRLNSARTLKAEAEQLAQAGNPLAAIQKALEAQKAARSAYLPLVPPKASEFRAVWIHTAYGVKDWGWDKSIRVLKENGLNAILPNMLWGGIAHYPSQVLPVADAVKEKGDQMALCLEACKKYGVELHPWKVNWNLSTAPKAFLEKMRAERRTQKKKDGQDANWLCPSHPANFQLELDSMLEVVRNYDVDGIHFDYIRFPDANSCYCAGCKERFEKEGGVSVSKWPEDVLTGDLGAKFRDWRCFQITRLVKAVSEDAHKLKPHVKVSAAVFGEWRSTRTSIGQDTRYWIEKGYLDFVCPMNYTPSIEYLRKLVTMQVDTVDGRMPLYIGIGAYQQPNEAALLDQVTLSRWLGSDGFILFQYDLNTATAHLPALREGATSVHSSMPHHAPEVVFTYPKGLASLADARATWLGNLWSRLRGAFGRAATPKHSKKFDGLTLKEGAKVLVGVQLIPKGNFRKPVKAADGEVSGEAVSGEPVKGFKAWKPWFGEGWRVKFRPPPGSFRVVVAGKVVFDDGASQPFTVKSRVIRILSRASLAELSAREGPPKVSGPGTRVGVWHDGHGAKPILDALKLVPGVNPFFIYNFDQATLDVCQVLVLPQAKNPSEVDAEARLRMRKWVETGGRLLVTHAAVGYRGHEPIVPDVCLGGLDAPRRTTCLVVADHPLTKNLPLNTRFEHSYYDHITLSRGASGAVVVADAADKSPVVILGEHGKGRVVASGLATGITKGDADCPPTGGELQVLLNAVGWLAE